jgi:uracil-DNA glycosylase
MSYTREDILRELELLPVWQLRQPLVTQILEKSLVTTIPVESAQTEEVQGNAQAATAVQEAYFLSFQIEGADCLMLHEDKDFSKEEEKLWLNICKAMQFSQKIHTRRATSSTLLENSRPKVIILFGEQVAQAVFSSSARDSTQSENVQYFNGIPCVTTFSLAHLLQHPLDKGQAWRSLCEALALLN